MRLKETTTLFLDCGKHKNGETCDSSLFYPGGSSNACVCVHNQLAEVSAVSLSLGSLRYSRASSLSLSLSLFSLWYTRVYTHYRAAIDGARDIHPAPHPQRPSVPDLCSSFSYSETLARSCFANYQLTTTSQNQTQSWTPPSDNGTHFRLILRCARRHFFPPGNSHPAAAEAEATARGWRC